MSTATVGVRRIKYNGDKYGGSATKSRHGNKGPAVAKGAVLVRPAESGRRMPLGLRGIRAKEDVSFPEWEEYANPRYGTLKRKEISEMLDMVRRRRKNSFHRNMIERLAKAVRRHLEEHRIAQCSCKIVAKGWYPLNPEAGTLYRLQVPGSDELFPIPKEFLPQDEVVKTKYA